MSNYVSIFNEYIQQHGGIINDTFSEEDGLFTSKCIYSDFTRLKLNLRIL